MQLGGFNQSIFMAQMMVQRAREGEAEAEALQGRDDLETVTGITVTVNMPNILFVLPRYLNIFAAGSTVKSMGAYCCSRMVHFHGLLAAHKLCTSIMNHSCTVFCLRSSGDFHS